MSESYLHRILNSFLPAEARIRTHHEIIQTLQQEKQMHGDNLTPDLFAPIPKIKQAKRMNNGKPSMSYILKFPTVVETFARIMELGACKYGDDNWKLGGKPDKEYFDSMLRHIMYWLDGEEFDPDSGCNHLTHAIWNLAALQELNYEGHVFNEELFRERCSYWLEERDD